MHGKNKTKHNTNDQNENKQTWWEGDRSMNNNKLTDKKQKR